MMSKLHSAKWFHWAFVGLLSASLGCSSLGGASSLEERLAKEPDAAFMKRVKNDPFPSAAQQNVSKSQKR